MLSFCLCYTKRFQFEFPLGRADFRPARVRSPRQDQVRPSQDCHHGEPGDQIPGMATLPVFLPSLICRNVEINMFITSFFAGTQANPEKKLFSLSVRQCRTLKSFKIDGHFCLKRPPKCDTDGLFKDFFLNWHLSKSVNFGQFDGLL